MKLSKLSPQARKALRTNDPDIKLRATVELVSGKSPEQLTLSADDGNIELLSWSPGTQLVTLVIASGDLSALAEDEAVTYVQVSDKYRL